MVLGVDNIYFAVNSSFFSVTKFLAANETNVYSVSVYPNPAKHIVNVKLAKSESAKYTIYDVSGRLVSNGALANDGIINVEKITNGNYILTIEMKSGEQFTEQLLIKK